MTEARALLREAAPAKVNLALHVLGRRADGLHELDSLVVFTRAGDALSCHPSAAPGIVLDRSGPFGGDLPTDNDNIIVKSAGMLAAGRPLPGATIVIDKRLPVASGIGGGSADAAATLRLLDRFWRLGTPPERLAAIALDLGADVPMCLASRPARIGGIGERVVPVELPLLHLVLVNPLRPLATAAVFRAHRIAGPAPLPALPGRFRDVREFAGWLGTTRNDLTAAALGLEPSIGDALRLIEASGALAARMSGSGATCFGLFPDAPAAEAAAARIARSRPGWWAVTTDTGLPEQGFAA